MAGVRRIACRLSLNEFQRDVLLNAVNREIRDVQQARDVPASLKSLAITQLQEIKKDLEESLGGEGGGD